MNTHLKQILDRLTALESRTEDHLLQASGVTAKIAWLEKMMWLLLSIVVTTLGTIIGSKLWH